MTQTRPRNPDGTFARKNGQASKSQQEATTMGPVNRQIVNTPQEMMQGFVTSVQGILAISDIAYRERREYQKVMRRDPDVMSPLFQRQMTVALLPWSIEPEDQNDEKQVEQADELKQLIESNMHQLTDFLRSLQEAVWYGSSMVNVIYERSPSGIVPTSWFPFHPDSIHFHEEGRPGIRVTSRFKGANPDAEVAFGPDGPAYLLSDIDRQSVVLHNFMRQGPEYRESREGERMYKGVGLRDVCFYEWMMKMKVKQFWMRWAEHYADGIREWHHPGTEGSLEAVKNAVLNLAENPDVLLPSIQDWPDAYKFMIHWPQGQGAQSIATLVEWLAGQIKEILIGQTATTEATTSGLGSDVATEHNRTFMRIIDYDAQSLADTLSRDFVRVLHEMNFGVTDYTPRWRFAVEQVNPKERLDAIKSAWEMGTRIKESDVRGILGLEEPDESEDVILQSQGGGDDPFGDALGFGAGNPNSFSQFYRKVFDA